MKLNELYTSLSGDEISIILDAYLETAMWADADEGIDTGDLSFDEDTVRAARKDVQEFYTKTKSITDGINNRDDNFWRLFGHDFWLTRNGHGTGFWDKSNVYEGSGDELSEIATSMGPLNLYIDDGKIYIDG